MIPSLSRAVPSTSQIVFSALEFGFCCWHGYTVEKLTTQVGENSLTEEEALLATAEIISNLVINGGVRALYFYHQNNANALQNTPVSIMSYPFNNMLIGSFFWFKGSDNFSNNTVLPLSLISLLFTNACALLQLTAQSIGSAVQNDQTKNQAPVKK